jgi:hypothetical protein
MLKHATLRTQSTLLVFSAAALLLNAVHPVVTKAFEPQWIYANQARLRRRGQRIHQLPTRRGRSLVTRRTVLGVNHPPNSQRVQIAIA